MKFIFALLIISVFQASAITRAQNVTIHIKSATFEDVFNIMHKQTDYNFIYNADMLDRLSPVNIDVKDKPLKEVLDNILTAQNLSYSIQDKTIIVAQIANIKPVTTKADVTITGTVVDEKGITLPGVTVKLKGSNSAALTDARGNFKIILPKGNGILVFSFVGYKTQEIPVNNQTTISVKMELGVSGLDEIVVIGYGTQKKKDLTGAVSSVKGEDIAANPVSNPLEAMQGRVAGLDIQRTDGSTGAAPNVLLRGNRSIQIIQNGVVVGGATQNPLYVIDGIIGNITSLNPNDIESIDVLKDASSTAIYGSAGANGVILITTKKAKSGKVQIDLDSYYGVNGFASYPKALSGDAWVQYNRDKYFATNNKFPSSLADANVPASAIAAIEQNKWIDWVDETLKRGVQQNHHVAVRGGNETVQAYMSLGYIGEKGIYQGDNTAFYNVRGGVDVKFSDLFKAGLQTTINLRNNNQTNSRINKAFGTYPLGDVYDANGNINVYPLDKVSTVSPIANYAPGVLVNNTKGLFAAINPYIEFHPITNLSIRSQLGVTLASSRNGYFANELSYNLASEARNTKEASYTNNSGYGYLWENIANYNFTLNRDHNFSITGITSYNDQREETSFLAGQGLDFNDYLYYNMGALTTLTGKGTTYKQLNKLSFAGRVNYSYKGKYLVQLTNRWDGASQLVKKWAAFPSGQIGWRISDEDFMQSTKGWLDNLKLRAGYGVAGTANINAYVSSTEVTSRTSEFNMSLGSGAALPIYVIKQALGNPDLTWEKSYSTNLGLDMTMFKGRLDVTTEVFYTKTKGVLYPRNIPSSSGGYDAKNLYTITSNIGQTSNNGIEVTINSRNIISKNFRWNTSLTFTHATEKLDKIDLGNSLAPSALISNLLFVGQQLPQSIYYGYKKTGIWQLGEETEAAKYGAKPGDIKLQTVPKVVNGVSDNGVHPYSADDRMVVGHSTPNFSIGLQNSFVYKAFDLSIFATMRYGQTINAQLLGYYNAVAPPAFYNYWTPTHASNDFPQPYLGPTINTTYASALSLVDGSYIKIKNITLGYTLPKNIAGKIGMSRLRVYGTAYNTLIFAKSKLLKNVDPETGGSDSFPLYKQIVFGLNASF
ncbi:MAG: TonB-dependent receptor [Mucilaginibacter sp.]|uniref:TonB-dependent receptor n=1 Tax=Mucilaginibacter sp. TaxID=1882438 RepID=UPI0031A153D1